MVSIIINDVELVLEPHVIDTNIGAITTYDVVASYGGATTTFPYSEGLEKLADCLFLVIVSEKGHLSHYRLVSTSDDELLYRNENLPWCTLKEALEWKAKFLHDLSLSHIRQKYDFYKIMTYSDMTKDWVKSYMPSKRGVIDQATRRLVYMKCDGHCAYCGKEIEFNEMQVDHVDSHYRHHGKDELDNYLPACRDCNGLKSDYLLEEFRNVLIPNCAKKGKICGDNRSSRICKAYKLRPHQKTKIVFYFEKEKTK